MRASPLICLRGAVYSAEHVGAVEMRRDGVDHWTLWEIIQPAIVPPAIALAFGLLVKWVVQGLKEPKAQ